MVKRVFKVLLTFILIINMSPMNSISYGESAPSDEERIRSSIEDLINYYEEDDEYSFREIIALNYTSEDIDEYIKKISDKLIIQDDDSASSYAGNIIGIIGCGKNPRDYEGEDYVKLLVDSQERSGRFIVKSGDQHPATLTWSIIALDMAEANYEEEDAVKALLEDQNEDGGFTLTPDIDTAAMVITALANHRNIGGVEDAIEKSLGFIKSNQLESGGFPFMGSDNPYSVSCVIQGLISNGINPLSEEWKKSGNSMLDALLSFKSGKHFEYKTKWGREVNSASEQAFMALADLYRGKSMYQNIRIYEGDPNGEKPSGELVIERLGNDSFRNGEEAGVKVEIKNNTDKTEEVTLIIVLYDIDKNQMINYTYVTKRIKENDDEIVAGGFLIPRRGEYEIRAFLWDNLRDMNILADPIYIEVK